VPAGTLERGEVDTPVVLTAADLPGVTSPVAPDRHLLANGLDVTIYGASALKERLTSFGSEAVIVLDQSRYVPVITDIDDPDISNKGDGRFHPFDESHVLATLGELSHPHLGFQVTVYILPYPRRSVLVSSTSGSEVFLSPHVLDIHPSVSAYIVAHEIGHVLHDRYMPDGTRAWDDYRRVRGIEDAGTFSERASHPYRPKEIFAEDFRVLFGGAEAAWDGRIENPVLPSPLLVAGLEAFMGELGGTRRYARVEVAASSFPNPFNPETEIVISVPEDVLAASQSVSVRIYNVRGQLVRDLYDGAPAGESLRLRWDGTDGRGNQVASSHYFAQIRAGRHKTTLKLVMLK
jgi:hypothetical protein